MPLARNSAPPAELLFTIPGRRLGSLFHYSTIPYMSLAMALSHYSTIPLFQTDGPSTAVACERVETWDASAASAA